MHLSENMEKRTKGSKLRKHVKISDYINLSRKENLESELKDMYYHGASYFIDEDKRVLSVFVPLDSLSWEKKRRILKDENRFTELIKKYGIKESRCNK